ncbi:MAG: hypothetical protein ACI845_001878 [Gammaproteobacteria bacterium]|jgi:hypothetical protein
MNISNTYSSNSSYSSARGNATTGLSQQLGQFEKSATEIAKNTGETSDAGLGKLRALIDQLEIVNHVNTNARALQSDNERIGTLIDLQA